MTKRQKMKALALNEIYRQNELKETELRQNQEQFKETMELEKQKLAVKDRVDISVKEYEQLKEQVKELNKSNNLMKDLLKKIKIGEYLEIIDFSSIKVKEIVEPMTMKKQIHICFDTYLYGESKLWQLKMND